MRKTALLISVAMVLTGCAASANPDDSQSSMSASISTKRTFGQDQGAPSPSPTETPNPSATSSKLAQSISQARNRVATTANSQVTCEKGSELVIGVQEQMKAPDLDELFLVAMVGCSTKGVMGTSVPEVFHWRDGAWTSVATIRIKNFVVEPAGAFKKIGENKLRLKVRATPIKGGAAAARTLEIRRESLSYWAEVVAS